MADTASTAPADTVDKAPMCSCGHDADAHRAGGDPAGRGCSACGCTRSPHEVNTLARRRGESALVDALTRTPRGLDVAVGTVLCPPTGVALGLALTSGNGSAAWLAFAVALVGVALLAAYAAALPA